MRTKRILFFAESVTLAHVARPIALAGGLSPLKFESYIACDSRYQRFLDPTTATRLPLYSISSTQFLRSLAEGRPVYDANTLRSYVSDDLDLIRRVKPDLIVGDFRLSLSVSARLAEVPYAAICNAYWSPYYARKGYPLPVLAVTRAMPLPVVNALFWLARPFAFAAHCRPLNQIRREHGLASLGSNLRRTYTDADHVLYCDSERLFPTKNLPANHHYLGPVIWSPKVAYPEWWDVLRRDRPIIYLTLGSSGRSSLSQVVLDALADAPVTIMVSRAGSETDLSLPENSYVADYLPGTEAAARSDLVICNGGSPTSHQALSEGVPVLGICSNMDQFLNMRAIGNANAGLVLRADRLRIANIKMTVKKMLCSEIFRAGAIAQTSEHRPSTAATNFLEFVNSL